MGLRAHSGRVARSLLLALLTICLVLSSCFPKTPPGGTSTNPGTTNPGASGGTSQPAATAASNPVLGADGQLRRQATTVRSADGAVANVPAGPVELSAEVSLSQYSAPDEDLRWDLEGSWRFISKTGLIITEDVTFDLPVRGPLQDAKVVALGAGARWVVLPTTQSKLIDGTQALRIRLQGIATPWVLAVARPRPGAPAVSELSRLEELYWTDRAAWETEAMSWLSQVRGELLGQRDGRLGVASLRIAEAAARRSWTDLANDLEWAIKTLGAVRAVQPPKTGTGAMPVSANQAWAAGIEKLYAVRKEWVAYRDAWASEQGGRAQLMFDEEKTVDQALETALATYAPWGIELTRYLSKAGALTGLDLAVIYGEKYWSDIPVAAGQVKAMDDEIAAKLAGRADAAYPTIKPGTEEITRRLRLYSTRAVEDYSMIDWLKDWKTEAFLRYLPAVLPAAGIGTFGPATVAAIAVDQVLNMWQSTYEDADDPKIYAEIEWGATGAEGASLFIDASSNFLRSSFLRPVDLAEVNGVRSSAALFVYSAALAYGVAKSDWYLLKDVRKMSEGSQAYCVDGKANWFYSQVIPPIQLVAWIKGDLDGQPADVYPTVVQYNMSWSVNLGLVPDLHQLLADGKTETLASAMLPLDNPRDGLRNVGFTPYKKELWPRTKVESAPSGQSLRLAISRDELKSLATKLGISPSAPLKDYQLVFRLEQGDGKRNVYELTQELPTPPGGDSGKIYCSLVLRSAKVEDLDGLPGEWRGQEKLQLVDGGVLKQTFTGQLRATSDEEALWEGPVRFTPADKVLQLDTEDVESPWVHVKELLIAVEPVGSITAQPLQRTYAVEGNTASIEVRAKIEGPAQASAKPDEFNQELMVDAMYPVGAKQALHIEVEHVLEWAKGLTWDKPYPQGNFVRYSIQNLRWYIEGQQGEGRLEREQPLGVIAFDLAPPIKDGTLLVATITLRYDLATQSYDSKGQFHPEWGTSKYTHSIVLCYLRVTTQR